jgi:hypothetical protein
MVSVFGLLYAAARSGVPAIDRPGLRGNAVAAVLAAFRLRASRAIARAVVAGVLVNEDASIEGDPRYPDSRFPRGRRGYYPAGDVGHKLGPAVGPGQVLSGLHLRRLGYTGDPLDLARVGNEFRALYYAAIVFREAVDQARDVLGALASEAEVLRWALARYNGEFRGGVFPDGAVKYATRAASRIEALGGLA